MIFAFCFALGLRLFIVSKEGINECGANPCLGECCVGFWCWYCSVAQSKSFVFGNVIFCLICLMYVVARHVYGYSKVFDGDGDPFRPDQYSGSQNV